VTSAAEPAVSSGLLAVLVSSTLVASIVSAVLAFQTQRSTTQLAHRLEISLGIYTKRADSYQALWEPLMKLREAAKREFTSEEAFAALNEISTVRRKHGLYLSPEAVRLLQDVATLLQGLSPGAAVSDEQRHDVYAAVLHLQDRLQLELESERPVA